MQEIHILSGEKKGWSAKYAVNSNFKGFNTCKIYCNIGFTQLSNV